MVNMSQRFIVERDIMALSGGLRLFYAIKDENGQISVAQPLTMKTQDAGIISQAFMEIAPDTAQQLIDQLWIAGCRPSQPLRDPQNSEHLEGEISWLRENVTKFIDHNLKG